MKIPPDSNPSPVWLQIVLIGYLLAGSFYCLIALFLAYAGSCPAFATYDGCQPYSEWQELWLFPGSQIVFGISSLGALLYVRRRWNR